MSAVSFKTAFCTRLRRARVMAGLSQKQLGIKAGLDEFVASARINRYETGVHEPDIHTTVRLASALGVPTAYIYADSDAEAELLLAFHALPRAARYKLLKSLRGRRIR